MGIKIGDSLPPVDLFEGTPDNKVNTQAFSKGRVIFFGLPGAFTPTCSKEHVPGFVKLVDDMKKKGVTEVVCLSINDPFVMSAWGHTLDTTGKIRFLADTHGELTKALGMTIDLTSALGSIRCKRFVMLLDEGKVKFINVEPDGTGLTCSRGSDILKLL